MIWTCAIWMSAPAMPCYDIDVIIIEVLIAIIYILNVVDIVDPLFFAVFVRHDKGILNTFHTQKGAKT